MKHIFVTEDLSVSMEQINPLLLQNDLNSPISYENLKQRHVDPRRLLPLHENVKTWRKF